jgi:L-fuculose-phosphate aldolase
MSRKLDTDNLIGNIIAVCHRLAEKNLVSATDGNVSARTPSGTFFATRSSVSKGDVEENDIVEVNADGRVVAGNGSPSSELKMHLFIYKHRPNVHAVVHAHPPCATAFAVAGQSLEKPVFPEVLVTLGSIPLAPYGTPSTDELPETLRPFVENHNAILLANHGVVTYGDSLQQAYWAMEKVEHAAKITIYARLLGGERVLTGGQIQQLARIGKEQFGKDRLYHSVFGREAE